MLRLFCWAIFIGVTGGVTWLLVRSVQDLHLRYWLGDVASIVLASLLGALSLLAIALSHAQCVMNHRRQEAVQKSQRRRQYREVEVCCHFSRSTLLCTFAAAALLSLVSPALALVMAKSTSAIASHLAPSANGERERDRCGSSGISRELERTHQELAAFHKTCVDTSAQSARLVHECPGFNERFPQPAPIEHYLASLEESMDCSGFCHASGQPLFVRPEHVQQQREGRGRRASCAARLARHLAGWSWRVTVCSCILGPLLAVVGLVLTCYDEL